jgi:hypothetical protein
MNKPRELEAPGGRRRVRRWAFAGALVALFWNVAALAWNDAGHRVVARLAYDTLPGDVQMRAARLLRAHPRFAADFASRLPRALRAASAAQRNRWYFEFAAIWPDYARDFAGVRPEATRRELVSAYNRPRWHYINLPTYLTDADRRLAIPNPRFDDVPAEPEQQLNLVQALTRQSHIVCDGDASPAARALAFSWLLHLMADLHQPLHATALYAVGRFPNGDRGGNDIALAGGGNLHAFWDAAGAAAAAPLASTAAAPLTFAAIAVSSRRLAVRVAYAPSLRAQLERLPVDAPELVALDADYRARANAVAARQLAVAGHRTAALVAALLLPAGGKCPVSLAF